MSEQDAAVLFGFGVMGVFALLTAGAGWYIRSRAGVASGYREWAGSILMALGASIGIFFGLALAFYVMQVVSSAASSW